MATTRKKVLWVDDEIEFLRSHIMFLETRGYSVTPVFNGDDALHILHAQPRGFDIVLLDEQMPGKDGLTVLEVIKDTIPELPVVMVTKSEEEQVMEDALGKKIDGYLTKPVNPSQILSVCKRLLDSKQIISSQIIQRFVRNSSEVRTTLQSPMDAAAWMPVYESLIGWDFELETVEDEGIRQAHAGLRSDADALFSNFFVENYLQWINGEAGPPKFTPQVVETFLVPRLEADEKVYFIVFDCLRLDQYMAIEPLLKKYFNIERHMYFANIPSTPSFARYLLFGGAYALDLAERHPDLWEKKDAAGGAERGLEEMLLREKLIACGLDMADTHEHVTIRDALASQDFLSKMSAYSEKQLVSMNINSVDLLLQSQSTSAVIQEMSSDEIAFRRLTNSWFQHSNIYQILRELSRMQCTVILTTGNGSVLCTRGAELYGDASRDKSLRFRLGENITCDERYALLISEPQRFKIPAETQSAVAVILKENYYFIHHDKFENYQKQYRNTFQHGGISLEEIVVPLAIMTPK